ncbi:MAG: PAS domain S-box protein [Microscillaceae bacterium]|nr:PAS domain S-box protein [Microscillaceae bacterium]
MRGYWPIILFALIPQIGAAQSILVSKPISGAQSLHAQTHIFTGGAHQARQIYQQYQQGQGRKLSRNDFMLWPNASGYWLVVRFANLSPKSLQRIAIIQDTGLREVRLFTTLEGQLRRQEPLIPHRTWLFAQNAFSISLPAQSETVALFWIKSPTFLLSEVCLWEQAQFIRHQQSSALIFGLYVGFLLALLLLNVLFFAYPVFRWMGLYLLSGLLVLLAFEGNLDCLLSPFLPAYWIPKVSFFHLFNFVMLFFITQLTEALSGIHRYSIGLRLGQGINLVFLGLSIGWPFYTLLLGLLFISFYFYYYLALVVYYARNGYRQYVLCVCAFGLLGFFLSLRGLALSPLLASPMGLSHLLPVGLSLHFGLLQIALFRFFFAKPSAKRQSKISTSETSASPRKDSLQSTATVSHKAYLGEIIEQLGYQVFIIDPKYRLQVVNSFGKIFIQKVFGLRLKAGMDLSPLFSRPLFAAEKRYLDRALQGEAFEIAGQYKDFYFQVDFWPIYNVANQLEAVLAKVENTQPQPKMEEEAQAQALPILAQSIATPALLTYQNLRIFWVNQAFSQLTGYSAAEIKGKHLFSLIEKKLRRALSQEYSQLPNQGSHWQGEVSIITKKGSVQVFKAQGNKISLPNYPRSSFLWSGQIASSFRKEAQMQGIMDAYDQALWVLQCPKWQLLYCNVLAKQLSPWVFGREALLFEKLWPLEMLPTASQKWENRFRKALKGQELKVVDLVRSGKDHHYLEIKVHPLFLEDKVESLAIFIRDISHRQKMEDALRLHKQRYELATAGSHEGMWDWDVKSGAIYFSPSMHSLLGYAEGELAYHQNLFYRLVQPEDLPTLEQTTREYLNGTRAHFQAEFRMQHKEGHWLWLHAKAVGLRDEEGTMYRLVGSSRDISPIKEAQLKIEKQEANLRAILDNSMDGIWLIDRHYRLVDFNKIFARTIEKNTGIVLMPGDDALEFEKAFVELDLLKAHYESAFAGERVQFEYEVTLNGEIHYMQKLINPIFEQGQVVGASAFVRNITQTKRAQAELQKAKQVAEEADLAKSRFLSTMSHEMRTSLNAVIGLTHLLLQEQPKDEQKENLQTLLFSAENLRALINDILDFNKIEAGALQLERIVFDLPALLQSLHKSFLPRSKEKNIQFILLLDKQLPRLVIGDPVRLSQVLNNLISNALKFTSDGKVILEVQVDSILLEKARLVFLVTDTGIGIEADKLDYIFESFTQADPDTTRKFGGTGLGLAITKKIIELHESKIEVESQPGKGSVFRFWIEFLLPSAAARQEKTGAGYSG